jgi:hypothetical protein
MGRSSGQEQGMKTMFEAWWISAKARMAAWGTKASAEEEYLAGAVDMADLEHRMRRLERQSAEGAFVRLRLMARAHG